MSTRILFITQKRYAMVNSVTLKIIARSHGKGKISVNAQAFVNGSLNSKKNPDPSFGRVVIPLSIYVESKYYDSKCERIKAQHPQAVQYNAIISNAKDRAADILRDANIQNYRLERDSFRSRFTSTMSDTDFVGFWKKEHQDRKGAIEMSTWKAEKSSLEKFKKFKSSLPFAMINAGVIEDYERFLKKKGNNKNTIANAMKNVKAYLNMAIKKEIDVKNPFKHYKISWGPGSTVFLTLPEQHKLLEMYDGNEVTDHLRETLLVFLVQSFTSLRISDAKIITPVWVQSNVLEFIPFKTRRYLKTVRFGLSKAAARLLEDLWAMKKIRKLKTEQRMNDDLKLIAALAGIRKPLTTHAARHTFATTFLAIGGDVVVLKEIMGHSKIDTTMRYVHLVDQRKTEQMGNFDTEFK